MNDKKHTIFRALDYGVGQGPPDQKPGVFQSWKEFAIWAAFGIVWLTVVGSLVLWSMGLIHFTH